MAWIHMIPEAEATGEVREAYAIAAGARGGIANILKIHSVHPRSLVAHLRLYTELMFAQSELTRAEREMISVAVSAVNACHY